MHSALVNHLLRTVSELFLYKMVSYLVICVTLCYAILILESKVFSDPVDIDSLRSDCGEIGEILISGWHVNTNEVIIYKYLLINYIILIG